MKTLTLSSAALGYLASLLDSDDDPYNAIEWGFSEEAWLEARQEVMKVAHS